MLNTIIRVYGYRHNNTIKFNRNEFSTVVKNLIKDCTSNTINDILITKIIITDTRFSNHNVFFSICLKKISVYEYYHLEYYDSLYDGVDSAPKLLLNPPRKLEQHFDCFSYSQHLMLPRVELDKIEIPCPIFTYYGNLFDIQVYLKTN
ncbi:MAG: hypothetical protein ACK5XF_06435 [Neisseriaceae bacterium]